MSLLHTFSIPQAAKLLGVSTETVKLMIARRQITSVLIGQRRKLTEQSITEYLVKNTLPHDATGVI